MKGVMSHRSRLSGFYKLSFDERRRTVVELASLSDTQAAALDAQTGLGLAEQRTRWWKTLSAHMRSPSESPPIS